MIIKEKITINPDDTMDYASSVSSYFNSDSVYGLRGEIASGKTTFVKGLLASMEYKEMVNSPTFTLINEYDAKYPVIHIDCYREDELERWIKLGINDYMNEENLVIIEWADKIGSLLPSNTIYVQFSHKNIHSREITLKA